jgi:hypothetical protein
MRFKDGHQDKHYIQENVVLFEAGSSMEARAHATAYAMETYAGDSDGTLTCDGRPSSWAFEGVRKCVLLWDGQPGDGSEISWLHYSVRDEADVARLMAGEDIFVEFDGK